MMTILEVLNNVTSCYPSNVAIEDGVTKLTYKQVMEMSDIVANWLCNRQNLNKGDIIGVQANKSYLTVITIIGILKANMAFVMIDSEYPLQRKNYLVQNSNCKQIIVIEDNDIFENTVNIHEVLAYQYLQESISREYSLDDIAYIVYTSGTTGLPKGSMVKHEGLVNMAIEQSYLYEISNLDRVLQLAFLSFDAAIAEIFETLVSGATLIIPPSHIKKDPHLFSSFIVDNAITMITVTPSFLGTLNTEIANSIKKILIVGEALTSSLVLKFIDKVQLFNSYGVSECSICSTVYKFNSDFDGTVKIGKSIRNVKIVLIDSSSNIITEPNKHGEICIGGVGVANGYVNNPKLTKQKFILLENESEIFYKTGDKAYFDNNGDFIFIGRIDNQIKIRGFRIEPGEIESVINTLKGVISSFVSVIEQDERKLLVAFIQSNHSYSLQGINTYISNFLPNYISLSNVLFIDKFPISAIGKIDRQALLDLYNHKKRNDSSLPFKQIDLIEDLIKSIFKVDYVSPFDDLFNDYGCDSLTAIELLVGIESKFSIQISIEMIYKYSMIGFLNSYIETITKQQLLPNKPNEKVILKHKKTNKIKKNGLKKGCFVVGATGLMGIFLLKELLKHGYHCFCLVRASSQQEAYDKLLKSALHYNLSFEEYELGKVSVVKGNVLLPDLGLSQIDLTLIGGKFDILFNCVGNVNHAASYSQLENSNVFSVKNLIDFLSKSDNKALLIHLSSCAVFLATESINDSSFEENTLLPFDENLASGYSISKFNAELLLSRNTVSLSYKVFRLDLILNPKNILGSSNQWIDILIEVTTTIGAIFIEDLGVTISPQYPSNLAQAIIELTLSDSEQTVFHLFPNKRYSISEFVQIYLSDKHRLETVTLQEWINKIQEVYQKPNREITYLINIFLDMRFKRSSKNYSFNSDMTCQILSDLNVVFPIFNKYNI